MKITELSDAQCCLLIARKEYPGKPWQIKSNNHVSTSTGYYVDMNWSTMGPLWGKYGREYYAARAELYKKYDKLNYIEYAAINAYEAGLTPRSISESIIWLWYGDEVGDEG